MPRPNTHDNVLPKATRTRKMPSHYIPGNQRVFDAEGNALSAPLPWASWDPRDEFLCRRISICSCCAFADAIDMAAATAIWKCQHTEQRWQLYPAEEMGAACVRAAPHPASACPGNCSQHTLMRPEFRLHFSSELMEFCEAEEAEKLQRESPAARARREAEEAKKLEELALASEVMLREKYTRDQQEQARKGKGRQEASKLILQPCKWMYEEVTDPRTGKAAPSKFNPKMECWAWRYTNPKTKKLEEPCTCMRLHPGQVQWCKEWEKMTWQQAVNDAKSRLAPPPAAPAQRFAPSPARGAAWAKPAPGAPKKPAAAVSRFGAFEESSDEDVSAW